MQSSDPRRHQLTPADVAAFVRALGRADVGAVERIRHGEWSQAFAFAAGGAEYVVRFSTVDEDFRKDQLAAAWGTRRLPVPPLLDIGSAPHGLIYAVAERASGTYLDALDADKLRDVLDSLFDAIDDMRHADIASTRGFGVWDATGKAPHATWRDALLAVGIDQPGLRTAGWRARLEQSPTGAMPFDTAYERLRELAGAMPNARHLIHSDLLNYNVLVEQERVSAVLDWGSAMFGDWLWDVAWFVFWQPWYPAWSKLDFAAEARRYFEHNTDADLTNFDLRLSCCAIAIGLDNQAYCAFKGEARWPQLAEVARRSLAF